MVALSTCEAEYTAYALSACQVVWIMNKKLSISLVKNSVLHGRSKHIDIEFHFLMNQVLNGVFEVVLCSTQK